ncbi:MAG: energy-coupling factor transporter ATPase [Clostridia bacterium]|nr:energy-coupling factor transporter ATPase [Clostridia bacterium]
MTQQYEPAKKGEERPIIIEARNVSFTYEGEDPAKALPAVNAVSVAVREGEYVCLLGRNGSGKSTLAKLFSLIFSPDSGEILINGKTVNEENMTEDELFEIRRTVGMVFQNPDNQLVATVVEEDVAFGPENLGIPSEEIRRRVDESLALVGMSEYAKTAPHMLSGGQKQRIAIAGVLAMMPRCIIFDEATAMLDPGGRQDVMRILHKLNKERGITVLNITHHMDEAVSADRIYVMNEGRVMACGTPREVFADVDALRRAALEAPAGTELLYELNRLGGDFELPCLDFAECAEIIANKIKEKN